MVAEHLHNRQKRREVLPRELRRGGMHDPIRVDISTTRHHRYRGCVCGSGEDDSENFLSHLLFVKTKSPLPIVGALSMIPVKTHNHYILLI